MNRYEKRGKKSAFLRKKHGTIMVFFGNMESYMELSCNFEDRDLSSPAYLNVLCLVGFCFVFP